MGTHTFTKVGVVDNNDLRQVLYAYTATLKDMMSNMELFELLLHDGNTLFIKEFLDDMDSYIHQLQVLQALVEMKIEQCTQTELLQN